MGGVKKKDCCVVKPAEETWTGSVPLSELDQSGAIIHVSTIHFYQTPSSDLIPTTLKQSLARVLVPFYPLAGRLSRIHGPHHRLQLNCNAHGVNFIEAESEFTLDHFLGTHHHHDQSPSPSADQYTQLKPTVDYTLPIEERPIMIAQLTRFACGGITLCSSFSHAVIGGQSIGVFLTEWARFARGEVCVKTEPFHDRSVLGVRNPSSSRAPHFDHAEEFSQLPALAEGTKKKKSSNKAMTLRISKEQMETLKAAANEGRDTSTRAYTRYEALTGHIWKCACKARKLKTEQATGLEVYVDVRNRLEPPLPSGYFGNSSIGVLAVCNAGEIMVKPLEYAASRVRGAIDKGSRSEYVWSYIDHLKSEKDLSKLQDVSVYGNPNMSVSSWTRIPLYGIDFGWGKEVYTGPGSQRVDGDTVILSSCTGDGSLLVSLCLEALYMASFQNHFYNDIP
ncbi:spermidine hydroxycinnamoyl transferase-like [Humulus lupulus]|uniref:spermidine hydroxycinnamoyl transferase-like n=1 Tax=Humulus lupulus TaxID=3486 RepID=UPI002B4028F3|nr:spermidine hydroxycinnamoyl transferase-like [Humulus lupulus]XP_062083775.1 spermidine hydroxycinnamoyl transferase-like [Humulus lupulus]